jgi:hypothetical protein
LGSCIYARGWLARQLGKSVGHFGWFSGHGAWPKNFLSFVLCSNDLKHIRWIALEVSGLLIEALLRALSYSLVRDIQINTQQRIIVLSAFGVRLL